MANDSKLINATGLWKNKDKNGNVFLAGSMGGVRVLVFPVKNKQSEKSPDYTLVFAPNETPAQQQTQKQEPEDF
jgi:hypothetical protein